MAYLSTDELKAMGFKSLGRNVKISDKASIYNADQIEIGDNSRIDDFCVVSGQISIGRFVHLTPFVLMAGGEKGVYVEDFATFAYAVQVFSQSDDYSGASMTNSLVSAQFKLEKKERVHIGKYVIIGASTVVLPGVTVSEGCSVGAMSLITKNTSPWGVYVGIPARRLKERKKNILELEQQFLESLKNDFI
jgi:acetyltransferase-like isoleucine patch superfamily enzyme